MPAADSDREVEIVRRGFIGIVCEFARPDEGEIARIEVYTGHERARRAAGIA